MPSKLERATAFRFIVCLGFVSLFADMTYEGAHSVIGPLRKTSVLLQLKSESLPASAK